MKLYIGTTKDNELLYIEWDKADNEQRKTFTLCGGTYDNPKTEEEGEEEARETLKDSSYYEDLGLIGDKSFLNDFIDYEAVAEHIINNDGWENTNGEFNHFGEYNGEEIYLNSASGGQHQEKRSNIKNLWISEEDFLYINKLWDEQHLKPLTKETLKYMDSFFDKYKSLCDEETALKKFLECIKWRQ